MKSVLNSDPWMVYGDLKRHLKRGPLVMQTAALAQIHCLFRIKLGYLQELFNYDPLKYSVTISKQYSTVWLGDRWTTEKDVEGTGCGLIRDIILAFARRIWGEQRKLGRLIGVRAHWNWATPGRMIKCQRWFELGTSWQDCWCHSWSELGTSQQSGQ